MQLSAEVVGAREAYALAEGGRLGGGAPRAGRGGARARVAARGRRGGRPDGAVAGAVLAAHCHRCHQRRRAVAAAAHVPTAAAATGHRAASACCAAGRSGRPATRAERGRTRRVHSGGRCARLAARQSTCARHRYRYCSRRWRPPPHASLAQCARRASRQQSEQLAQHEHQESEPFCAALVPAAAATAPAARAVVRDGRQRADSVAHVGAVSERSATCAHLFDNWCAEQRRRSEQQSGRCGRVWRRRWRATELLCAI